MGIESVFPDDSSVPSLDLQIGGTPLTNILADLFRLIRRQQQELEILRCEVGDRFHINESSSQKHDEAISMLLTDLKLHVRPISCYGQPPMMTMSDAVTNIDYRLARVENATKNDTAVRLGATNDKKIITPYYNRWILYQKLQAATRSKAREIHKDVCQQYMRKWVRYLSIRARQRAQQRHLFGLLTIHDRRVLLSYWRRWYLLVDVRREGRAHRKVSAREKADILLHIVSREIALHAFQCWMGFLEASRNAKTRAMGTLLLERKTARLLVERYLQKWIDAHRWRRLLLMRFRALDAMQRRMSREMARCFFCRWVSFALRRRQLRRVCSLVPHFHHAKLAALARRYFSHLYAYRLLSRDVRRNEALEKRLQTMNERADALQRQLDVGLHTLAHTNSVLARVVDAVAIAEEPRSAIQHLLQEEMMATVAGGPSASDICRTPPPPVTLLSPSKDVLKLPSSSEHEWKLQPTTEGKREGSVGEMLKKLRARLDDAYNTKTDTACTGA